MRDRVGSNPTIHLILHLFKERVCRLYQFRANSQYTFWINNQYPISMSQLFSLWQLLLLFTFILYG